MSGVFSDEFRFAVSHDDGRCEYIDSERSDLQTTILEKGTVLAGAVSRSWVLS